MSAVAAVQLFFAVVIGLYFWNLLRTQQGARLAIQRESRREIERLQQMRQIRLNEPLSERTRPTRFEEIVGQDEGLRALRAALCGRNPQHVLIYGPPGVGKTAAARLVLEEAKANPLSPFGPEARFVEVDGATSRWDERGIADPLIGSVHDPIYQGAGAMGMAGIPQPKPGAVTRAHGGILFIDEIGELHPIQLNKLLKVLEDRKVILESAYYNAEDPNIPSHIRDIFENGLPADFRLVGATTRLPEEIPQAIRSRCVEVFFRPLTREEVATIARNAAARLGMPLAEGGEELVARYASNGRDAVNLVQVAAGLVESERRGRIERRDLEWVVRTGQYTPRLEPTVAPEPQVGVVNGLAVVGPNVGALLEIEASARPAPLGAGGLQVTGIIDEEEMVSLGGRRVRRRSMVWAAAENAVTALRRLLGEEVDRHRIHVNFPGGVPVDGPSAGAAIAVAVYSALMGLPVDNRVAITGEVTARGTIRPVGGVPAKVLAAVRAGARHILVPRDNLPEVEGVEHRELAGARVQGVERLEEALAAAVRGEPRLLRAGVGGPGALPGGGLGAGPGGVGGSAAGS
ncbi:MAG: ATP-dependent protease LonB [Clostridia bacterium]|nr:ATP-dependent protease LonB [Clostridia bacterium]